MEGPDLRPKHAAARFGISRGILAQWAAAGLIGVSRPSPGIVLYHAPSIQAHIDRCRTAPKVTSLPTPATRPAPAAPTDDWRSFWAAPSATDARKRKPARRG